MIEKNTSAQVCQDETVYKHDYLVTVTHTMGGPAILKETVSAGSKAHAAMQVGMLLLAMLLMEGENPEDIPMTMHNIKDHMIVDVQLIV